MYVVGLTGGIGSGKSAVSDRFKSLGIEVIDADVAARTVVEKGKPALKEIARHFGAEILLEDGGLNRPALRQKVFADTNERGWLEKLLHPLIFQELKTGLDRADSVYSVLVSPLLIETGQYRLTQRVLVVDAPEELQLARASARGRNTVEQVKSIMATQASREQRLARADDVIANDKSLAELDQEVAKLHRRYLSLAQSSRT